MSDVDYDSDPPLPLQPKRKAPMTTSTKTKAKASRKESVPLGKQSTELTAFDGRDREFIYEGIDQATSEVFYVGRTSNCKRRAGEHDRKTGEAPLLRARLQLAPYTFREAMRIVPELPDGVPASRSGEFEAFFIAQRGTLHNPNPDHANFNKCNCKNGDHVVEIDYKALEEEIANGIKWPEASEVSKMLGIAIAKEALLSDGVDKVGDLEPELSTALVEITAARKALESAPTPYEVACKLYETYDAKPDCEEVARDAIVGEINAVCVLALDDALLQEQKVCWMRSLHSDKFKMTINARYCKFVTGMIKEWIAMRDANRAARAEAGPS